MNIVIGWAQTSVQRQLAVVAGVSSALFLALARVVFGYLAASKADGRIVNVAGRQRMLTQRMARQALAVAAGDEGARRRLSDAAGEFEQSLTDLAEGAPRRGIPRSRPVARERLRAVQERWPPFASAVATVSGTQADAPAFARALGYLEAEADGLLEDTDRVVAYFDDAYAYRVQQLRRRLILLGTGGAVLLGATYLLLLAGARRRAERAEADVRLKEHQLAELAEERRDLVRRLLSASEDERRRVAADIHDGPTQQLTGAAMLLEAALQGDRTSTENLERMDTARGYLEGALEDTRRIITDLRPPLLDDLGVAEALQRSLRTTAQDFGIAVEIEAQMDGHRPDRRTEVVLYRVAHEAVMNAVKHSGADCVQVRMCERDGGIALKVSDGGRGFDPATVTSSTGHRPLGLLGMRERIELLGGRFAIDAAAGRGTTVTAWVPDGGEVT